MVVITSDQRDVILNAVQDMYSALARDPEGEFHFPTGRAACEFLGYPDSSLDPLPPEALASFAGVGYPFQAEVIRRGDTILDVGSGSGTDALIAASLTGSDGEVLGLDLTEEMRERLRHNAEKMGYDHVRTVAGNAEEIPLPDDSVDVVTSNGVLNLVPDKPKAVQEIRRVLRPGGRIQISDIVLETTPSEACRSKPELWAECIVGATKEEEYLDYFRSAGFADVETLEHVDYFSHSPDEDTREVAHSFGALGMVLRASLE